MDPINKIESDPETVALGLFASRPSILKAFLELTENGFLENKWNPLVDPVQWEYNVKPTDAELRRIATIRLFHGKGFIERVTDEGKAKFRVNANEWAMEVRKAYNHLPQTLKDKIIEELSAR